MTCHECRGWFWWRPRDTNDAWTCWGCSPPGDDWTCATVEIRNGR